ncbi:MAG: DUF6370 family protein [Opitutaceae bacterium]
MEMMFWRKSVLSGLAFCGVWVTSVLSGEEAQPVLTADQLRAGAVVAASCGQCQFGMEGDSCDLAVRINGQAYFVDGTGIDDHGDAHATDGFCSAVRSARVAGSIIDGRFHATSFVLLGEGSPDEDRLEGAAEEAATTRSEPLS